MKINLILFIGLVTLFGCSSSKVSPAPTKIKITKSTIVEKETKNKKESTFFKDNLTQEDAITRVFKNCFKTGSTALNSSCKRQIDAFLKTTSLRKKRIVLIEVHTDKSGSVQKNLAISIKRAQNTAGALYYKEYKNSDIYYKGFGESKLIYDAVNHKANLENRRVVVKLRSKEFKVDKKVYKLYTKSQKKKTLKKTKLVKIKHKKARPSIASFSGEADIGWIYFGKPSLAKKFRLTCRDDKPLKVRHKAISKSKKTEFMSHFYNRKITASFANEKLEIYPVYVYENGKLPISNPMLILKGKEKIERFQTTVNTYRGKKGILYRIFVNGKKRVSCVDLVISYKDDTISYGRIYMRGNKEFTLKP